MTEQQLARAMVQTGLITTHQVQTAAQQRVNGKRFADIVVELGWVSPIDILQIDPSAFDHLRAGNDDNGNGAHGDMSNGADTYTGDVNGGGHGYTAAPDDAVYQAAAAHTATFNTANMGLGQESQVDIDDNSVHIDGEDPASADANMGTTRIVCNELLRDAVARRASDMHLEPTREGLKVRYRIDGQLRGGGVIPLEMQAPILSRLKVLGELDISENRLPQDGRFRATIGGRTFDFRVSSLPSMHGEKLVLRLLDRSSLVTDLRRLGFSDETRGSFEQMLQAAHGMVLVTGPTGSGKTTTLYAALDVTRDEAKNVVTVEDPVEYELEGVTQTNVQPDIGLTFAAQLRAILRQDPDVVLVGEIRDNETADIAIRAALTGHLLLSTMHTNSAAGAVTRLQDMDVPPFLIASSLSGVLAQRLVRLICRHCRQPLPQTTPEYEAAVERFRLRPGTQLYRGTGCSECNNTGVRGRIAIIELMQVDRVIRKAIMDRAEANALRQIAVGNGMKTLWQDGIEKMTRGLTTAEEVTRVLLGSEDES